jgi:hypothetical protein
VDSKDVVTGHGTIKVEKYYKGEEKPYDTMISHNIWLNTGWDELLKLIIGTSANHFNGTNTKCGIGDDATAADVAQTDLLAATNKTYVTVDSGYPTQSSQVAVFQFTFGASSANYAWSELVIKNNASSICWNRNATGWGSKTSAEIWMVTVTLGKA